MDTWGERRVLQSCKNVSQAALEWVAFHHDIGPREIEGEDRHVARGAGQGQRRLLQIQGDRGARRAMRGDMSILGAKQVQIVRAGSAQPPLVLANSILDDAILGLGSLSEDAAYFGRGGDEFRQRPLPTPVAKAVKPT